MNYFLTINGTQQGPFTPEQLKAQGLRPETLVWTDGMAQWDRADRVAELQPIVASPPVGGQPAYAAPGYAAPGPQGPYGPVTYVNPAGRPGDKKMVAGLCGIFLGAFGVHKFILGYNGAGAIMLISSLLCIGYPVMHVIGLIEGIMYLTKNDDQFYQEYMVNRKEWFEKDNSEVRVQYFFADGDVQKGPFPIEALCAQGLQPDSLVWREGMSQWQRADSLAELASIIPVAPASGGQSSFEPAATGYAAAPASPYPSAPAYQPAPGYQQPGAPMGLGYQQPGYYGGYGPASLPNGMAVASMILGILAIPMMFAYCLGTPCAIVAIVLGHIARGRARCGEASGEGMALAGLICGYISVLLVGAMIAIVAIAIAANAH